MEDSLHIAEPVAFVRPRGAHRFEAFSPKLKRRLTFYRRCAFDQWVLIESDPVIGHFCERPGFIQFRGRRHLADFLVSYSDRQELILLLDPVVDEEAKEGLEFRADVLNVRLVDATELAASRIWIDNWQRMLPSIVATRGLVSVSLLDAVERFVASPKPLLAIEREFSKGDPVLVRAAIFTLLQTGRVHAEELRTDPLSWMTKFAAVEAAHDSPQA
ncbi:hypothetical protein [Cupriavidus basilensis]|uniref:hypothetical protein n=1 Tax=Cupriavidus basilensis TaxID=68895 RepID=UPI0023E85B56|nr:hypothetical protein [Cupriavidus basilensis]MDF3887757.1 hypothetical protein [Cupriavidus basilensis]